ncbi:MAG: desulfoferrodoxin family protein [Arenicellales bacterium]|jgi:superoxide reductase
MNKREFIRIGIAGSAGALFVPSDLMAGMVEPALKTKLAGGVYHTATAFGRWNQALADHHLPMFDKQGTSLHVATNHPMNAYGHWIIKHQLLDSNFNFITEHIYDPTSDKKPETTFDVGGHSGVLYVLTMCNVHDLWVNATEA